jgi:hypothetical protein
VAAEAAAIAAERERSSSEAAQLAERRKEAEHLHGGAARAVDLVHAARHQRRSDQRLDDLRDQEHSARAELARADQASGKVRAQLGKLQIEVEIARRAESRQQLDAEARLHKHEDEVAEEAWTAGFVARRNG